MAAVSPHLPFISALKTYYSLLADLRYFPHSSIISPPHAQTSIDLAAARENGFNNSDTINLLLNIPYLEDDEWDSRVTYETTLLSYLHNNSEQSFEYARDPMYQDRRDFMPSHAIVLTDAHVYGTLLIYDLSMKSLTSWKYFDSGLEHWTEAPSYTLTTLSNQLYQWIISLLTLETIVLNGEIIPPLKDDEGWFYQHPGYNKATIAFYKRDLEEHRDKLGLKEVYMECGWDPTVASKFHEHIEENIWQQLETARQKATQAFREKEFQERREEFLKEVERRAEERQRRDELAGLMDFNQNQNPHQNEL